MHVRLTIYLCVFSTPKWCVEEKSAIRTGFTGHLWLKSQVWIASLGFSGAEGRGPKDTGGSLRDPPIFWDYARTRSVSSLGQRQSSAVCWQVNLPRWQYKRALASASFNTANPGLPAWGPWSITHDEELLYSSNPAAGRSSCASFWATVSDPDGLLATFHCLVPSYKLCSMLLHGIIWVPVLLKQVGGGADRRALWEDNSPIKF